MSKYLFFTDDDILIAKIKAAFPVKQVRFKSSVDFPSIDTGVKLAVVDGDFLPPAIAMSKLERFKRKKIPLVFIFTDSNGKSVMELLNNGVISVLFKDFPPDRIKRELTDILCNFNYLEKVKDIAENENRTKQFFKVVNSLTSDNDINKIMNDILAAMIEALRLESTVFFIVKNNRLTHKLELGEPRRDYSGKEWELNDLKVDWLKEIQLLKKPVYITKKSKKGYKRYFPENTLLLPLVIKDRFLGLIAASLKTHAKELSRNEITLLKAFAEQTAVALENAKLYWDVIQTREKLVKKEKEALFSQTILSLNHEINNPLSIISMEAQLLQKRLDNNENSIEPRIVRIEKNIERIKMILEKISSLNTENIPLTNYILGKQMLNLHEN